MRNGFSLGRIAGIQVFVDWSLLVIFLLITFGLSMGLFPAWHPDWSVATYWVTAAGAAVLFFASVLLHELSHAVVGRAVGIRVPRITLFIFGGMAHMESEPRTWKSELVMTLVGPITSFALGIAFLLLAGLVAGPIEVDPERPERAIQALGPLPSLLLWLGPVNLLLAVFNLVPGFPLDGGRALRAVLWGITGNLELATRWASRAGQLFAWILIGTGLAMILGVRLPILGGGLVNGLWLAFIGWFLNNAALMSYRQLLVRDALEDVRVSRLMQTRIARVAPATPIRALVDAELMSSGQRAFPVEKDGELVGLVSLTDLRKSERNAWERTPVSEVMTETSRLVTVKPDADAAEALELISRRDLNQLPVLQDGKLVGLLRREDVLKWLALHQGREPLPA